MPYNSPQSADDFKKRYGFAKKDISRVDPHLTRFLIQSHQDRAETGVQKREDQARTLNERGNQMAVMSVFMLQATALYSSFADITPALAMGGACVLVMHKAAETWNEANALFKQVSRVQPQSPFLKL